jgi:hypothetical protein
MKRTIIVTALLPLVMLAGCATASPPTGVASATGDGTTVDPAAATNSTEDPEDQGLKFAQCMRDNGIADFPDPNPNGPTEFSLGGGADEQKKFEDANKACAEFAPGTGGEPPQVDQATIDKMREFSQCMRDHGLADFPDPETEGGGIRVSLGGKLNPDSADFKAAQDACQNLMPEPPGGDTGGIRVQSGSPAGGGS